MLVSLLVLSGLICIPSLLIIPAWFYGRRHHGAIWALPLIALPAHAVEALLNLDHVGPPKSLASLSVEFCILDALGVVLAYLQVFFVDPRLRTPGRTTLQFSLGLVGVAVAVRLFMPLLPE